MHPKGFINIFFESLNYLKEQAKKEKKVAEVKEHANKEEEKNEPKKGTTNL